MVMQMDIKKRLIIKNTLLYNMSVLEDMLEGGSGVKRRAIRLKKETLKLGLLHMAFVGQTSCGKSTAVNGISKQILLPENPMTCTPVPTYITKANTEDELQGVTIVPEEEKKESKELTRKEFITKYCYNEKDQGDDPGRLRFQGDRYAVVHSKGELFKKGVVLLDTLGSGATESDNIKTTAILKGNVDFVIYVIGDIVKTEDIAFLQCFLLGYTPKDAEVKKMNYSVGEPVVTPDRLIILGNDKSGILRGGFIESIKRIFKSDDCKMSEAEIVKFCEKNVWIANALYGRLKEAGFFDYVENAPVGSSDQYLEDVCRLNRKQKRLMKSIKDEEDDEHEDILKDIEKWHQFENHIKAVCDECFEETNYFMHDKCNKVKRDFKEAKQSFEKDIRELKGNLKGVKARAEKLGAISKRIEGTKETIIPSVYAMSADMISCVKETMYNDTKNIINEIYAQVLTEKVGQMTSPADGLQEFAAIKKMTDAERLKALQPVIEPILSELLAQSGYKTARYLWSLSGSESEDIIDVPIKHYKMIIRFLNGHIDNLQGIVSEMKDAGVSIAGIVLPDESDLIKIGNDMEIRIQKAIESSFDAWADTKNWESVFKERISSVLKQGVFGKIASWFKGGVSKQEFWDKIRAELLPKIHLTIGVNAIQNIDKSISRDVNVAYLAVGNSIRDLYVQCKYDCDAAIRKIKELDEEGAMEELIRSLEKKIEKCNKAIAEIDKVLQF